MSNLQGTCGAMNDGHAPLQGVDNLVSVTLPEFLEHTVQA